MNANDFERRDIHSIFEAKRNFHKERAKLPIEEKIKILVQMQRIAHEISIKKKKKNVPSPVWNIL
ncbi:MAG: hypothetical protein ACM3SY_03030 [Candidatus Omnitrophota bacterium]